MALPQVSQSGDSHKNKSSLNSAFTVFHQFLNSFTENTQKYGTPKLNEKFYESIWMMLF